MSIPKPLQKQPSRKVLAAVKHFNSEGKIEIKSDQPRQNKALHPTAYSFVPCAPASVRSLRFRRRVSLVVMRHRDIAWYSFTGELLSARSRHWQSPRIDRPGHPSPDSPLDKDKALVENAVLSPLPWREIHWV
jgi:hypothetical protein